MFKYDYPELFPSFNFPFGDLANRLNYYIDNFWYFDYNLLKYLFTKCLKRILSENIIVLQKKKHVNNNNEKIRRLNSQQEIIIDRERKNIESKYVFRILQREQKHLNMNTKLIFLNKQNKKIRK